MAFVEAAVSTNRSPLKGALLGMLAQGPSHGYELANRLERQLGPTWTINRTSLYRMLRSLQAEGLISADPSDEANLARTVYRATPAAEPALAAWMDSPLRSDVREQLQARMVVARHEDLPRLVIALNGYERSLFSKRAEIEEGLPPRQSLRAAMMYLVREASLQQIRGELMWIDISRRLILDLIGSVAAVR
jgi:DNA-binding PadR family transcriptional regulator